mmetsp:Transcript_621/g.1850  ORF Transcript_621/g.1850 Transcript_621/m.1850 type:complete len:283 (-) Transcript_621:211-1059(-)
MELDLPLEGLVVGGQLLVAAEAVVALLCLQILDRGQRGGDVLALDIHLAHGVELWYPALELFVRLDCREGLQERSAGILRLGVALGHVGPDLTDPVHERQGHREHLPFALGPARGLRPGFLIGAGLAGQEHIKDPLRLLVLRLHGLARVLQLNLPAGGRHQDAPAPVCVAILHVEQAAWVQERHNVRGLSHNLPELGPPLLQLLRDVVVVGDGLVHIERVLRVILNHGPEILDPPELSLKVTLLVFYVKGSTVLLELVEAALDHVVRIRALQAQQVNEHVVT